MAIEKACHLNRDFVQQYIRDVRQPNGLFTPQTLQEVLQSLQREICDVDSLCQNTGSDRGESVVVRRIIKQINNGSIIVSA